MPNKLTKNNTKSKVVCKSIDLLRSPDTGSEGSHKIFNMALSNYWHMDDKPKLTASFTLEAYCEATGLRLSQARKSLQVAMVEIESAVFEVVEETKHKRISFVDTAQFDTETQEYSVLFNSSLIPYISNFKSGRYIKTEIDKVMKLKNMQSRVLYERVKQWRGTGSFKLTNKDLLVYLDINVAQVTNKGHIIRDLKRYLKEIEKKTGDVVEVTANRVGNKTISYTFTFSRNKRFDLELGIDNSEDEGDLFEGLDFDDLI